MSPSKTSLLEIVERFSELSMLVVGDLILDHYIWGEVSRISPEAPVVVVHVSKEEYGLGGAANVAKNIRTLGAQAAIVGTRGTELYGTHLIDALKENEIDTQHIVELSDRTTTVKSRVIARSQQVVRVDRESQDEIPADAQEKIARILSNHAQAYDGTIVSDYAKGVVTTHTFAPLAAAAGAGNFSLRGRPLIVDPKNANFSLYSGASVVKPNKGEAEAASGVKIRSHQDAIKAAEVLLDRWSAESILITLGELGMVGLARDALDSAVAVPTRAQEVYDVSGAGDTVAAVYGLALSSGASIEEAAELSNIAAGVVVAEVGAVAIGKEELCHAVEKSKG